MPGLNTWLRRMLRELGAEELEAMVYFLEEVSVGELAAYRDLRVRGVRDPQAVARSLVEKGFLEKGEGCYNLPRGLRDAMLEEDAPLPETGARLAEKLRRLTAPWITA